ncbi:UNC93-like protein MFSD11 [Paramacrobiotus metropolitanus]|uniref:UNC93-like protein MFSD11 n=1 Tax=Paramacrobiotus metropolitanus TaxID=2943436 RepID=UPI002445AFB6|nr:UNC93-like protein MFSD11 [Paramacrobiotus metropolitanus]XP_055329396.1 UNC93-like protein MFSD11 [Paramacrobiotus metropolitanus]
MEQAYVAINSGDSEENNNPNTDNLLRAQRKMQLRNVILVGIVFMLLSSASQTSSTVETIVIDSVHDQYFNGTSTLGYKLLAVLNGVIAGSVWISQTMVANIGPKYGMLIGGVCYCIFVSTFIRPLVSTLFAGVVILGVGQAVLWTSEGVFLSLNSDKETIGRNSAVFWALYQTSLLWGNFYFFYKMNGAETIDDVTRYWIFGALVVLAGAGTFLIMALKYPVPKLVPHSINADGSVKVESAEVKSRGLVDSIRCSLRLITTKRMLFAMWTFIYIGLEQTFWSNVYDSSLGYTKKFGTHIADSLVGLSGVFVGIGEILGSIIFGLADTRFPRMGRDPVIICGFVSHMVAIFLVFINIPNAAPLGATFDDGFIHPSFQLALFCSVLFGFGDSAFNTQLYSYLGEMYAADSVPAFALFQFIWGLTCCGAFFYATVLHLYIQLLILAIIGSIATITFCKLEWDYKKTRIPFLQSERSQLADEGTENLLHNE